MGDSKLAAGNEIGRGNTDDSIPRDVLSDECYPRAGGRQAAARNSFKAETAKPAQARDGENSASGKVQENKESLKQRAGTESSSIKAASPGRQEESLSNFRDPFARASESQARMERSRERPRYPNEPTDLTYQERLNRTLIDKQVSQSENRQEELKAEIRNIEQRYKTRLKELCQDTKNGVDFFTRLNPFSSETNEFAKTQTAQVEALRAQERLLISKRAELNKEVEQTDSLRLKALVSEYNENIGNGNRRKADDVAVESFSKFGSQLSSLAPQIWKDLTSPNSEGKTALQRQFERSEAAQAKIQSFHFGENEGFQEGIKAISELSARNVKYEDVAGLRKDALLAIDADPKMQRFSKASSEIANALPAFQELLKSGEKGTKFESFTADVRQRSEELESLLRKMEPSAKALKQELLELQKSELQTQDERAKEELHKRVAAIENGLQLFDPESKINKQLHSMINFTQSRDFDESTVANWLKKESITLAATIGGAVLAASYVASVISTGGLSLSALPAIAAASAAGGLVAREGTNELLFHADNALQIGIGPGRQSLIGEYVSGNKVIEADGTERNRTILQDVVKPYAKQYAIDFGIMLTTMGVGSVGASAINQGLVRMGSSRAAQFLAEHSPTVARITENTKSVESVLVKSQANQKFANEYMRNIKDTFEQVCIEKGMEKALNKADAQTAVLSGLLLAVRKGVRLESVRGSREIRLDAESSEALSSTLSALKESGFKLESKGDGKFLLEKNGESFTLTSKKFLLPEGQAPLTEAQLQNGVLVDAQTITKNGKGQEVAGARQSLLIQHRDASSALNSRLAMSADSIASCNRETLTPGQQQQHVLPESQGKVSMRQKGRVVEFISTDKVLPGLTLSDTVSLGNKLRTLQSTIESRLEHRVDGIQVKPADNPTNPIGREDACVANQAADLLNHYLTPEGRITFIIEALTEGRPNRRLVNMDPAHPEAQLDPLKQRTQARRISVDDDGNPVISSEQVMARYGDATYGSEKTSGADAGLSNATSLHNFARRAFNFIGSHPELRSDTADSDVKLPVFLEDRIHAVVLSVNKKGEVKLWDPQENRFRDSSKVQVSVIDGPEGPAIQLLGVKHETLLPPALIARLRKHLSNAQR